MKSTDFTSFNSGSAQPSLNRNYLANVPVTLPPLEGQRAIAEVLGALDDKIDANHRAVRTLANLQACVFSDWYGARKGESVRLGSLVDIRRGVSYSGKDMDAHGVPMITLGSFSRDGSFNPAGVRRYSGAFKSEDELHPGDLVVANTDITQGREVLGRPLLVPPLGEISLCSHHVSRIVPRRRIRGIEFFLYGLLSSASLRNRVGGFATGTTVLAMPSDAITECRITLPTEPEIAAFSAQVRTLYESVIALTQESQLLARARDMLLPKLISGEIQVQAAEALAEEPV